MRWRLDEGPVAMSGIFICYRRADSAGWAGRIYDRLTSVWEDDQVFWDIDDIGPGADFRRAIDRTLKKCDIVLAVIGEHWLKDPDGNRPIDSPTDYVRMELSRALKLDRLIIPVLVGKAEVPRPEELPPELTDLSFREAFALRPDHFDDAVRKFERVLERVAVEQFGHPLIRRSGAVEASDDEADPMGERRSRSRTPRVDHQAKATSRRRWMALGLVAIVWAVLAAVVLIARSDNGDSSADQETTDEPAPVVPTASEATAPAETETSAVDEARANKSLDVTPTRSIDVGAAVMSLAFSSDGSLLASGTTDATVRLWDAATGELAVPALEGHSGWVLGVAFSPNSPTLASAGDGTVRLWDTATGQEAAEPLLGHTEQVSAVVFSPDGSILASASDDDTVRLWDTESLTSVRQISTGEVLRIAFSPDGSTLATASNDGSVRLWDPATGSQRVSPLVGHTGWVWTVAFSPDGRLLASAGDDSTVRLWEAETGQPVVAPLGGHVGQVYGVAFSPDGTILASGGHDATVRLWDPTTGLQIGEPLTDHDGPVQWVTFSPDGATLVSAGDDGTIRFWDLEHG